MDYQQLPAPPNMTMNVGGGGTTNQTSTQHLQQLMHGNLSVANNLQILTSMQPPPPPPPPTLANNGNSNNGNANSSNLPLQVVHNLTQIQSNPANSNQNTTNAPNNAPNAGPNTNTGNHQNGNMLNSQILPPSAQLIQLQQQHLHHHPHHHHSNGTNNNNNNNNNNSNNNAAITANNGHPNGDDSNRWTQFQMQQLWRHHAYLNGKASSNSKDICGSDDKFKEDGDPWNVEAQAAFLGPNLWDKTLPYDTDLKVTHYADLDEFLSENNIPDGLPGTHLGHSTGLNHRNDSLGHSTGLALGLGHITTKRERSPSPSDCVSPDTINPPSPAESTFSFASSGRDFDPRTRAFSDEELKPQPMIKKSRKQFVPDELKDDKYWARRRKNNIAAKRSRDARRQKENQIAMRARYLEKENSTLHQELEQLKQENMELRARLSKYQDI